ncbi:MAG: hypothetical protein ABUL72_03360, partial [Armatimonadota bacterium]
MAWASGELVASKLAGTTFSPPLKLVKESGGKATWNWAGKMRSALGLFDAKATGSSEVVDRVVNSQKVKAVQVTLVIDAP